VLNADNARAAEAASRGQGAKVYWFSVEHPVPQGAWLEEGYVVYRAARDAAVGKGDAAAAEFRSRARTTWRMCWPRWCARGWPASGRGDSPRRRELSGRRASPGVRGHHQRRRVLQRLQGHQRGRHGQGHRRLQSGIHLILGGKDKGSDYTQLAQLLRERVRASTPSARRRPRSSRTCAAWSPSTPARRWTRRSARGLAAARPGEVVLLAPACSSFDQFENYEHRGRVFKELVKRTAGMEAWQNA
jgi:UDP-N-acetylmuramoylalanine--D-glutamate ligase